MAWIIPHIPTRPVDIYTVRIFDPDIQPHLLSTLKRVVETGGGRLMVELVESRGFIFSTPTQTPSPLSNYMYARWLEEGCIHISKTTLEAPATGRDCRRIDWASEALDEREVVEEGEEDEGEMRDQEEDLEHPNARMQWTWSELRNGDHAARG